MGAVVTDPAAYKGTYLTDGKSLFYIFDYVNERLVLEDCLTGHLVRKTVTEVCQRMELVRPEVAA